MKTRLPKIVTIPNPVLRRKSQPVDEFDTDLVNLINNLTELLKMQKDPIGLGISAPQIGVLKRVFVIRAPQKIKPFVNPIITHISKKRVKYIEGCLSIPLYFGHVLRPADIEVEAFDQIGKKFNGKYSGLISRAIQHELDHLNGVLFIDHVHAQNGQLYQLAYDDKGEEQFIEVALEKNEQNG